MTGTFKKRRPVARPKGHRRRDTTVRSVQGARVTQIRREEQWAADVIGAALHVTVLMARAADLGIVHASHGPTAFPGVIYLSIQRSDERTGRLIGTAGDAASSWVGTFLREPARADVLSKLDRSGAADRHAFVVVPSFSTVPADVTDLLWSGGDGHVPTGAPPLPPEVTHVWLAPTWSIGSGLRWSLGDGWKRFSTLNEPREE